MVSKGLQVAGFWLTKLGDKAEGENPGLFYLQTDKINKFLDANQDIEIHSGRNLGPFIMIWYRKIDANWRERRGPEA